MIPSVFGSGPRNAGLPVLIAAACAARGSLSRASHSKATALTGSMKYLTLGKNNLS